VAALRAAPGRDVWLFGGGSLFRSLLRAKQVDLVEVLLVPVLLGAQPLPATKAAAAATYDKALRASLRCCGDALGPTRQRARSVVIGAISSG
jgi:dihydrofolate reductase